MCRLGLWSTNRVCPTWDTQQMMHFSEVFTIVPLHFQLCAAHTGKDFWLGMVCPEKPSHIICEKHEHPNPRLVCSCTEKKTCQRDQNHGGAGMTGVCSADGGVQDVEWRIGGWEGTRGLRSSPLRGATLSTTAPLAGATPSSGRRADLSSSGSLVGLVLAWV